MLVRCWGPIQAKEVGEDSNSLERQNVKGPEALPNGILNLLDWSNDPGYVPLSFLSSFFVFKISKMIPKSVL